MVFDAVRSSLNLLSGVTDATRSKATEAAAGLVAMVEASPAGGVASQVSALADELLAASSANREQIVAMLQKEVEAAVGRAIVAVSTEVAATSARVADVQRELNQLRGMVGLGGARRGGGRESSASSEHPPTEAMAALAALAESEVSDEPTSVRPKRSAVRRAPRPSTHPGTPSAVIPGASAEAPVKGAAVKNTPVKKTAVKKTAVKKTAVKKTAPAKTAPPTVAPPTVAPPTVAPPTVAADVGADE